MHGDAAAAAAAPPQGERGRRPAEDAWAEQAAQAFQEPNNAGAMLDPGFGVGGVQLLQEGSGFRSRTEEQLDASTDFACAPPVPPCAADALTTGCRRRACLGGQLESDVMLGCFDNAHMRTTTGGHEAPRTPIVAGGQHAGQRSAEIPRPRPAGIPRTQSFQAGFANAGTSRFPAIRLRSVSDKCLFVQPRRRRKSASGN